MSSEASVERCSVCGQDWHAATNLETVRALSQATIASLTAEKDAAERRVVELAGEVAQARAERDQAYDSIDREQAERIRSQGEVAALKKAHQAALSQERTARESAERERDAREPMTVSKGTVTTCARDSPPP